MRAIRSVRRAIEKNGAEIRAILTRSMPLFLRNRPVDGVGREIPVFVFHGVAPEPFEAQLRHLADNSYSTVTADELADSFDSPPPAGHRIVALTFDDATGSFWATAYPLLKKYGFKGIVFAVAGLVPDDDNQMPSLEDVWAGRAGLDDIEAREREQPLCSWRELRAMHESGLVDIQSHSLTHVRVPVADRPADFVNPDFDPYFFGNVDLPLSRSDRPESPERIVRPGAPVYRSAPRLSGIPHCLIDPRITDGLVDYVRTEGGDAFFESPGWRKMLHSKFDELRRRGTQPVTESEEDREIWIRREFTRSKELLEENVPGLRVRHFCYPWFTGCAEADRAARESGYRSVHYGVAIPSVVAGADRRLLRIRRFSEEYLHCLPGTNRRWPVSVWAARCKGLLKKTRHGAEAPA